MYAKGQGIVMNEPTVIALNKRNGDVLAMGREAWQMIGRTPSYIIAVRPLRQGAITDFDITQRMIRLILQRAGVTVTTRKTRGDDIAAACGQLAGDVADRTRRSRRLQLKEVRP